MTGEEGIFELRVHHVRPTALEPFADLAARAAKAAKKHAELVGQWTTEPREVGRLVELWKFIDFHHRAAARARIARQNVWKKFLQQGQPMITGTESLILLPLPEWPFSPPAHSAFYELRDHRLHPGTTMQWLAAWSRGMAVRQHFSRPVGLWQSDIGELNRMVTLWPYSSLQHRHDVRRAASKDPVWRDTVATLAPMMQRMEATILVPTEASGLQ
jgi:NIPSNAP protein